MADADATPQYPYGRINKLARELARAAIEPEVVEQIMAGGEDIGKATRPALKAEWMRGAMQRMDDLLDRDTRQAVREGCACCLGGKRLELSRAIARGYATLEERIAAANRTPYVFGHGVTREADGRILVHFEEEGKPSYRCVCLHQTPEPVSITYCYCCGGHIKHHLQIALERALECEPLHTALSSGGTRPCVFAYTLVDEAPR